MKRYISLFLVLTLLLSQTPIYAEENTDFFGSIGGFLGDAWNDASNTAVEAWNNTSSAVEEAWNSTSSAAEEAWDATSKGLTEAWDWTAEFIGEQQKAISESTAKTLQDLQTWVAITGDGAVSTLRDVFDILAGELGIAGDKATELWNTINDYSREHNINLLVIVKLTLAIMVRLTLGGTLAGDMAGNYISDTIVAWFTDNGIDDENSAEKALAGLGKSLDKIAARF